jgi:predicted phosphodiesterase
MSSFDLISDIHLDFWVTPSWNIFKEKKSLEEFIQKLLPPQSSAVLVIAGDIGHYNKQNYKLLKALKEHYTYILLVAGNHDYYMLSPSIRYKYAFNSINRLDEMKKLIKYLSNYPEIYEHWKSVSNDAKLMRGKPRDTKEMFYEEKRKLARILPYSDVIITHFSPDWSRSPQVGKLSKSTSFYYFDGAPFFPLISKKIWCFGHMHRRIDYEHHGCRFINASLGYPQENEGQPARALQIRIPPKS